MPAEQGASVVSGILPLILPLILLIAIYFIPTIIAVRKNHFQKTAIILINIFLGWSFVGWVVALVWAVMKEKNNININN